MTDSKAFLSKIQNKEPLTEDEFYKGNRLTQEVEADYFNALIPYLDFCSKSRPKESGLAKQVAESLKQRSSNSGLYGVPNAQAITQLMDDLLFTTDLIPSDAKWVDAFNYLCTVFYNTFASTKFDIESDSNRTLCMDTIKSFTRMLIKIVETKPKSVKAAEEIANTIRQITSYKADLTAETIVSLLDVLISLAGKTTIKTEWDNMISKLTGICRSYAAEHTKTQPEGNNLEFFNESLEKAIKFILHAVSNPKSIQLEITYQIHNNFVFHSFRENSSRTMKHWDHIYKIFTSIPENDLANKTWDNIFDEETAFIRYMFTPEGIAELEDPSDVAKINDLYEVFVDYMIASLSKKTKSTKHINFMSLQVLNKSQSDPAFAKKIQPKTVTFLKNFPEELNDNSDWSSVATYFLMPFMSDPTFTKKPSKDAIEMILNVMRLPSLSGMGYGIMNGMQQNNARVFAPFAAELVKGMKSTMIMIVVPDVYKFNPEPFHNATESMLQIYEDIEPSSRSTLLSFLWNISKVKPGCLTCFIENQTFRDGLFSNMTAALVVMILKEYANHDAKKLVDWVDDLKMFISTEPMHAYSVAGLFGLIGRIDEANCDRMLKIMDELMTLQVKDSTATMGWIVGIKDIQQKFPQRVSPFVAKIRDIQKNTNDQNVRNCAQMVIDVEDHTDLKSVNQKVEKVDEKVEEVKVEVKEQNVKIETMDAKVTENTAVVTQVKVEVAETKQKVNEVVEKVEQVEIKVEEQEVKIQQILDRFDEMNAKVSESCKNFDELKEYVDKNISMVKEFVAEVVKKLPNPYKFTSEGKVRRTLMLYFECCMNTKSCMFTKETPFKTETSDWAKWLKIGFSLFKLTKCLYDKDIFGTVDTVKDIYNDFKSKEDANFMAYISQPFLTSAEQDSLINQLRDQRFFDLFQYDAQKANWCCVKCARHVDTPVMELEEKKESTVEEPKGTTAVVTTTTTTATATVTKSTSSSKLESHLKVSVGFMKRITKVWCVLNDDKMVMYDKDKKGFKQDILRNEIVDIKDVDSRVTKRNHSFSIITKSRSFTACAPSEEMLNAWKQALLPK